MAARSITRRSIIGTGAVGAGLAVLASGKVVSEASAQTAPKTFVLIHGAWVAGWYWRRVSDLLERKGHKVFSPSLTGLGERSHLLNKDVNLDTHVTDIVNVIKWESLNDICFVAHSYGGLPASGALDQIGDRVSSIVWLDAFKPKNGDSFASFAPARRAAMLAASERGELGFNGPKAEVFLVNEKDRPWFDEKATPQPIGTFVQPIKLSGLMEKVSKKTYIRAPRFANPAFDQALAECKADKTWTTLENTTSGHVIMLDEPEWLADQLLRAA
jgi:pimeloyl-ACP methyl ester carboxylesterase